MADLEMFDLFDEAITRLLAGEVVAGQVPQRLLEVAQGLRDMPDERFRAHLAARLAAGGIGMEEERTQMSTTTGVRTVTPYISIGEGARFIEFLKTVFDAEELNRQEHGPGDAFHSMCRIGDSALLVSGGEHARRAERPTVLHIYVSDCDATYAKALAAGAVPVAGYPSEPGDRPYGERSAFVDDPFGNRYYIGARLAGHYMAGDAQTVVPYFHPASSRGLIDFLKAGFGAEEVMCHEQGGKVGHAVVRVGGSIVEMGDADRAPISSYVYYDDVDGLHERTVAAGAVSLSAPADRFYGDRAATVRDPFGNDWTLAKHLGDAVV